jgi:ABC-2 type transport system ATP-binding protein
VRGIDLTVAPGEVFALLGPNGAGKTTVVEILEGHRRRSAGEVSVLGYDPGRAGREYRERIGIVLQQTGVERFLTVAEAVERFRSFYPAPLPLDDVIGLVGLTDQRDERVRRLSGGQQRRLDVAIGLAGNPELLFLDEPTTGFDPSARRGAWEMIKDLQSLGTTILLTTHYLDEAQHLADRVAVMADGVIVAEGPPAELGSGIERRTRIEFELPPGAPPLPTSIGAAFTVERGRARTDTDAPTRLLHELTTWAVAAGIELPGLAVTRPSLEDVYLRLTDELDGRTAP